jgi:hypothetical protein
MSFLTWLQDLSLVTWVRESDSLLGYTLYLAGHTIGLVFLLGPNLLIAARVLGLAPDLPLAPLAKFRPVMAVGFVLILVSGLVLFATAPVGYVHNIVFIVKLAAIAVALACLQAVLRGLFGSGRNPDDQPVPPRITWLTAGTLLFWTIAVVAGRLTAYSGVVVVASIGAFLTVVVIAVVAGLLYRFWPSRRAPVHTDRFALDVHPRPAGGGK